jgi:hypothetical protein
MTYIPSDIPWHKKQEYVWLRGGDLSSFRSIWALPRMVMTYIPSDAPWHKEEEYIQFRGKEFNGFQDIGIFPLLHPIWLPWTILTNLRLYHA